MACFYHMTPIGNVPLILSQGLKPSAKTGVYNKYFGIRGDPDYIYLWGKDIIKLIGIFSALGINPAITIKNTVLLKINTDQFVERDYDQLLYLLQKNDLEGLSLKAEKFGIRLREFSEEKIKQGIDTISEEVWNKKQGSFRVREINGMPSVVEWSDVTPRWALFLGTLTRPLFKLKARIKNNN